MANKTRDAAKERFWRDMFAWQSTSGLSVRAFCRREGLTESAFHAWRRTIGERDMESPKWARRRTLVTPGFLPARITNPVSMRDAATPPIPGAVATSITIEWTEGLVLRLPESTPVERIAELARALREPLP